MYRNSTTGGECRPCPRRTYSDVIDSPHCTSCPAGETTRLDSSRSSDCHTSKGNTFIISQFFKMNGLDQIG